MVMNNMETITRSVCCRADVHDDEQGNWCAKCHQMCAIETVCAYCLGTGERTVEIRNSDGILEPTGTEKCICK
jgi:hypothetical protein